MALIRNAVNQGRDCIDAITARLGSPRGSKGDVLDVVIAGAGPAGISASLRAIENGLNYVTLERDEIGGTVSKYPRQKLVMTSPVEFPIYGRFRKTELSKESLIEFWDKVANRAEMCVRTGESLEDIQTEESGILRVTARKEGHSQTYRARAVILALGRAGTPRKLGVRGEELPKVMYRLIEADHYINRRVLIVGGGDSAVEAAMGLARQTGNQVTLCYRQAAFARIKERNAQRVEECIRNGTVRVMFNTNPVEIRPESVTVMSGETLEEIPNDYVWIFAGGIPPNDFLKKVGVRFGPLDITLEASQEAHRAGKFRQELLQQQALEPTSR